MMKPRERLVVYPTLIILFVLVLISLFKPLPDKATFRQLSIVDEEGNVKINLVPKRSGGMMKIFGPTNNIRIKLSTVSDGGMIELFRSIGRRSVWFRAVDNGGLIRVFGWEGKDGVKIQGSENGGSLSVNNRIGETKAELMIGGDGEGKIKLFGSEGEFTKEFSAK